MSDKKFPRWWIFRWEPMAGADQAWRNPGFANMAAEDHKKWPHRQAGEIIPVMSVEEAEAMVREAKAEAFEACAKYFQEAWERGTPKCDILVSLANTAKQARAQQEARGNGGENGKGTLD